jgi:hypothetical protein
MAKVPRRLLTTTIIADKSADDMPLSFMSAERCAQYVLKASCPQNSTLDNFDESRPRTPEEPQLSPQVKDKLLTTLKQLWLLQERMRSDPDGTWEIEAMWAKDVYNGNTTLGEADGKR